MTTATEATRRTDSSAEIRFKKQPPYHVVMLDDDEHTYDYVIELLQKLFGFSSQQAYLKAVEVDSAGKAIIETTTKERAEFKRDQIHAYGRDWRITSSLGSMSACIEPAPG